MLTPNELVFYFWGVLTSVTVLVKIDQEMRPWHIAHRRIHKYTDRRNRFYNLSHAICYSYGADTDTKYTY